MAALSYLGSFHNTVEGRASQLSCSMVEGRPTLCAAPISEGSQPNLKMMADFLRSSQPILQETRDWLAELVDPESDTELVLVFRKRTKAELRKKVSRRLTPTAHWSVAEFVEKRMSEGRTRKQAFGDAIDSKEYSLNRASIEGAMSSYREAADAHKRAIEEEGY